MCGWGHTPVTTHYCKGIVSDPEGKHIHCSDSEEEAGEEGTCCSCDVKSGRAAVAGPTRTRMLRRR